MVKLLLGLGSLCRGATSDYKNLLGHRAYILGSIWNQYTSYIRVCKPSTYRTYEERGRKYSRDEAV